MYGLITGSIIGSTLNSSEQDRNKAELFTPFLSCTAAVLEAAASARGLMRAGKDATYGEKLLCMEDAVAEEGLLSYRGKKAGASLVCAAPAAWLSRTMEYTIESAFACASAMTEDEKCIDRAVFFAQSVFMVRCGMPKKAIRQAFSHNLGFRSARKTTGRRNRNHLTPLFKALTAFLQGNSFEDTIRRAIELGGDTTETAAAAGELAAALYGIPAQMRTEAAMRMPDDIMALAQSFESRIEPHPEIEPEEPDLNGMLETAVTGMIKGLNEESFAEAVKILAAMGKEDKCLYVPVRYEDIPEAIPAPASLGSLIREGPEAPPETPNRYEMAYEQDQDGKGVYLAFTSAEQMAALGGFVSLAMPIKELFLQVRLNPDCSGIVLNRRAGNLFISKDLTDNLLSYTGCTSRTGMEAAALRRDVREFGRQNVGLFTGKREFFVPVLPDCEDVEEGGKRIYLNHLANCIYMEKHVLIPANPDRLPEALRGLSVIDGSTLSDEELDECALRTVCIKDTHFAMAVAAFTNADQFCLGPAVHVPMERLFSMGHRFMVLDTWDIKREFVLDRELQDRLRKAYEELMPNMISLRYCPVQTDRNWPEIRAVIYSTSELAKLDAVCIPVNSADGCAICGTSRSFLEAAGISSNIPEGTLPDEGINVWEKVPDILNSPSLTPLRVVRMHVPEWRDNTRMELMQLYAASGMALVAAARGGIRRIAFMAVTEDGEYPAPECARYCVEGAKTALAAAHDLHESFDIIEWLVPDSYYRELYSKEISRSFLS